MLKKMIMFVILALMAGCYVGCTTISYTDKLPDGTTRTATLKRPPLVTANASVKAPDGTVITMSSSTQSLVDMMYLLGQVALNGGELYKGTNVSGINPPSSSGVIPMKTTVTTTTEPATGTATTTPTTTTPSTGGKTK